MKSTVKRVWAHDFYEAYARSLKVKGKHIPKWEQKIVDMKHHERNAKPTYLWNWLVKNKHIIPNKYRVVALCAVCKHHFDPKKWDGTILKNAKAGNLVCPKCVKKARKRTRQ